MHTQLVIPGHGTNMNRFNRQIRSDYVDRIVFFNDIIVSECVQISQIHISQTNIVLILWDFGEFNNVELVSISVVISFAGDPGKSRFTDWNPVFATSYDAFSLCLKPLYHIKYNDLRNINVERQDKTKHVKINMPWLEASSETLADWFLLLSLCYVKRGIVSFLPRQPISDTWHLCVT